MKQPLRYAFTFAALLLSLMVGQVYAQTKAGKMKPVVRPATAVAAKANAAKPVSNASELPSILMVLASDKDEKSMVAIEQLKTFPGLSVSPMDAPSFYLVKAERPETLARAKAAYPELPFLTGAQLFTISESFQQAPEIAKTALQMAEK